MAISYSAGLGLNVTELALDPATWDLAFPPKVLRGAVAVAQRIKVRFRWFLGEWFLDQAQGVPYFEDILVKNPDPILISFIFRQVLLSTPGVKSVQSFSATLDAGLRHLTADFQATLDDDTIMTAISQPFVISDQVPT